jgi:hypothetical protein
MTAGQLMFYQGFSLYKIFMQQTQFITRNVASTFAPEKVYHRPPKQDVQIAFQKTMDYLIEHEDEQITVIELIDKMSEFCGDMAYTSVHMKSKLQDYFGDNVIITELNGKRNVITLRKTARVILHEFHQNQSLSDPEQEKRNCCQLNQIRHKIYRKCQE